MMTASRTLAAALLAGALVSTSTTPAHSAEGSVDAAVYSAYVWRGQVYNDESVLQPGFTTGAAGWYLNAWGNMPLTDNTGNSGEFNEVDLTLSYVLPLDGPVGVEVGILEYLFPKEGDFADEATGIRADDTDTREVYAAVSLDAPLSPSLSAYWDIDEAEEDAIYVTFGLSHSESVTEQLSVGAGASVGYGSEHYNDYYFGVADPALNDANVSASASYAVSEALSVGAEVVYTWLLDSDIEEAAAATYFDDEHLWGGVTASLQF